MKKKYIIFILAVVMSLSFVTGVFAANNFSLVVNGKKVNTEIKQINGVTYLPLRTVADALGIKLTLEGKTIYLTTNQTNGNSAKSSDIQTMIEGSRQNPITQGEATTFTKKVGSESFTGTISVESAIRGEKARTLLSFLNNKTLVGDYLIMDIKISIDSASKEDILMNLNSSDFNLVSANGTTYPLFFASNSLTTTAYVGSTIKGSIAYSVRNDDTPQLVFGRNEDGSGGVWLQTASPDNK